MTTTISEQLDSITPRYSHIHEAILLAPASARGRLVESRLVELVVEM